MGNYTDLIGKRFGQLYVIERVESSKNRRAQWRCLCDCGEYKTIIGNNLLMGRSLSCGHDKKEHCKIIAKISAKRRTLDRDLASFNKLLSEYKHGATTRNKVFELTTQEFRVLTSSNCYYCGALPKYIKRSNGIKSKSPNYIYNGIDRVNNTIGYIFSNCVPCCKICNIAKNSMTQDEFFSWIEQVHSQKLIRDAVQEGRVKWETIQL